jgi:cytochrome b561
MARESTAAVADRAIVAPSTDKLGLKNTKDGWGIAARAFHWILGLAIFAMIAFGYWMNHWAPRPDRFFYRSIHADIGYIVLLLTALRLIWRAINPTPAWPSGAPAWQRIAAYINHVALYLATLVVTFLGWAHAGAHRPNYASWFGLFDVPQFTSENPAIGKVYEDWHIWAAYVLLGLIAIHVAAALYHHVILRDRILMRMIDGKSE